jgi:hypothetical protein
MLEADAKNCSAGCGRSDVVTAKCSGKVQKLDIDRGSTISDWRRALSKSNVRQEMEDCARGEGLVVLQGEEAVKPRT